MQQQQQQQQQVRRNLCYNIDGNFTTVPNKKCERGFPYPDFFTRDPWNSTSLLYGFLRNYYYYQFSLFGNFIIWNCQVLIMNQAIFIFGHRENRSMQGNEVKAAKEWYFLYTIPMPRARTGSLNMKINATTIKSRKLIMSWSQSLRMYGTGIMSKHVTNSTAAIDAYSTHE